MPENSKGMIIHSVCGGFCAAASSFCGKLAGLHETSTLVGFVLKILLIAMMIAFNVGVWTCFVKALQQTNSSLSATVCSCAVNYICSALLGLLVFRESTSLLWWCGASMVLLGLFFICQPQKQHKT